MNQLVSIYLGPFLRVPPVVHAVTNSRTVCGKTCGAIPPPDAKFCPACGSLTQIEVETKQSLVKLEEGLLPAEMDSLFSPEKCEGVLPLETIWLPCDPNQGRSLERQLGPISLLAYESQRALELKEFEDNFAWQIDYIEQLFNVKTKVDWGIVSYQH